MNYMVFIFKLRKKMYIEFFFNKLFDIMGYFIIYKIIIINEGMWLVSGFVKLFLSFV